MHKTSRTSHPIESKKMDEPTFTPLHPKFIGKFAIPRYATTERPSKSNSFFVDLARGICTCSKGAPFIDPGDGGGLLAQSYCQHKLKALAKLMAKADDAALAWPYTKALTTRYNKYEVVSAFHKELRRGDYDRAIYWGCILSTHRGLKGVIKYLLNILYEETRDHTLGAYLLSEYQKAVKGEATVANVCKCVAYFCIAPKKWELKHRYAIFEKEMEGYRALAKDYTYDVAKGSDIIPVDQTQKLTKILLKGFADGDLAAVQYGLKGLYKSKSACKPPEHKDYIFGLLVKLMKSPNRNGFAGPMKAEALQLHDYLIHRRAVIGEHGYHEINAFADLLAGEPFSAGITPASRVTTRLKQPLTLPKPGLINPIPLYAHDNHTWMGKAYLRSHKWQLGNGVKQTDIDFRWCGAYLGVAWRYLAHRQHGTVLVDWGAVKWPPEMHKHVMKMFY